MCVVMCEGSGWVGGGCGELCRGQEGVGGGCTSDDVSLRRSKNVLRVHMRG